MKQITKKVTKKPVKKVNPEKTFSIWPKKHQIFTLVLCLAIPLLAWVIWSWFTTPAISTWYEVLIKPSFVAPNRAFAPVWTILFVLMWVSLFLITRDWLQEKDKPAMTYFLVQLFLNILRSVLFFYIQSPILAFIEIIVLWIFVLVTSMEFYKANKQSWLLFIPYLLWVIFAWFLNYYVMILN